MVALGVPGDRAVTQWGARVTTHVELRPTSVAGCEATQPRGGALRWFGAVHRCGGQRAPERQEWLRRGELTRCPSDARRHPGLQQAALGMGSGYC
ncbi:hypothetical protein NDU88_005177 [Pleurodeles waltl]|uniref:Uncharacterized protein n=1 Tax=Pleurodeles waltl TaxID=8319 RepID=A0AAV7NLR5_PLEWA|nr:hypothetical protein NDU88_005177 [Pleurodeles waltl]